MVSEELTQRDLNKKSVKFLDYEYFPIGSTTIKQLKKAKIIPNKNYGKYELRKPDGIITGGRVIAIVEYKKPSKFQTEKQKREAIEQCNDLCQVLEAQIGIITDGIVTYWINPNQPDKNNSYKDRTTREKRSYSFVLDDDKQILQKKFIFNEKEEFQRDLCGETKEIYKLIQRILEETGKENSELKPTNKTDPTPLAKSVWQSIYISTKDNPTACLYNVVELFIFKFLSDLGVLNGNKSFANLLKLYKDNNEKDVLKHYASICREEIRKLFKKGDDGTTIINGTIFVDGNGKPVLSQATLFKDVIEKYEKFGDLKSIDKGFKTKLFETFLKQDSNNSKLGQFFTPRKVVKAVVEMADIDKTKFICDPFCGVGGFVLEPFQVSKNLKKNLLRKIKKLILM